MEQLALDNPLVVTKTITYTHFKIKDIIVNLNQNATFIVILYTNDNDSDVKSIEMNEAEYNSWGSDDNYVINFIKQKISEM